MTENTTTLEQISGDELDLLLSRVHEDGRSELVLLGPGIGLNQSPEDWPETLRGRRVIFQLTEFVDNLGEKLLTVVQLNSLILWDINIDDTEAKAIAALTQLTSLDLSNNSIGEAGAKAIATLTQLTSLDLWSNSIGDAGAKAIATLPQLRSLDLSNNSIGDAGAKAIAALPQLTSLSLSVNSIGDAGAKAIATLPQLRSLDLSNNSIGDAGAKAIATLTQLTSLTLSGNSIGDAGAKAIAALPQLTSLSLSVNSIGDAGAKAIATLPQLTSLNLSFNSIGEAGAKAIATLPQLTSLTLSVNSIGDAGAKAIATLPQLTSLTLSDNSIGEAGAKAIATLPQLTSLNLRSNSIGEAGAKAIATLPQLTSLNLSDNSIGDAGAKAIATLPQLTSLDLSGNSIGEAGAKAIATLPQLRSLDLSNNSIGDAGAKAIATLTQLTNLYLSKTQVADLTPLANLPILRKLDVSDTMITDLSPLKNLFSNGFPVLWRSKWIRRPRAILVGGCPLVHPPPEVVKQGNEAVLNYFLEIETQGVERLFEAKVLIVGEGGSGKTSLLRRLYQPEQPLPSEDETTKGIDIYNYDFQMPDGRTFRLNVWDFGGQQIYHATHQFFLTKRSLYVLVDDTRKDHKSVHDEGFKYWLEVIEVLSDRSPVLIFQNEKGGRSKTIDEAGIKGRFPDVKDVYRGNLEDPNAAVEIYKAIEYFVQKLPHIGEEVPAKWVSIRAAIQNQAKAKPYISQQDYFNIYSQHLDFDRAKALHLSRYLHDLGVFLHFQDDIHLRKTVILKNRWATEAVFRILDDETVKGRLGRFTLADCNRVWAGSDYADAHPELLALMEKFELCYLIADASPETWLAPQLLSPSTPKGLDSWAEPGDLVLSYRYVFLPKGLVSRLIVRIHRFVQRPDMAWVTGVLFELDETQVLVKATDRGNEIVMRARGPESKALLSVIASELDALNTSFCGLEDKVGKWVPCVCTQCAVSTSPELFEQRHLLQRKHDNKLTIECPASYENVSVLELLDGLKLDELPHWADEQVEQGAAVSASITSTEPAETQTIKIFLASSKELQADRDEFDLYFRQQNDLLRKKGLYLQIVRWENFLDAMAEKRLQDEYNREVRACDIFVSLFMTKTGKYTEEEFDVAHQAFNENGKPLIYTFFKNAAISTGDARKSDLMSLWRFQDKLKDLGHFQTQYDSTEHLKRQFKDQLEKLLAEGRL